MYPNKLIIIDLSKSFIKKEKAKHKLKIYKKYNKKLVIRKEKREVTGVGKRSSR